jgi:hypothetical protein
MRNLNLNELDVVQGGGIALKWAFKMGEAFVNGYTIFEASSKLSFDFSNYGGASAGGFNPMGDFSSLVCAR